MSIKEKTILSIIKIEGGYVNDPDDSGGETNYGITKKVARQYGYSGAIEFLPKSVAYEIYAKIYWDSLLLDQVKQIAGEKIAHELADTGINMGVARAGTYLQRSLNVLNYKQQYYADITVDGGVGKNTITALTQLINKRGDEGKKVLYAMLNCLQGAKYVALAEKREKDEKWIFGWYKNRVING